MSGTVIRDYEIPAGEAKEIYIPGLFLMVLEASSALDITFIRNGSPSGEAEGVKASFTHGPLSPGNEFHGVKIASSDSSAQTVKIGISDDEIGYQVIAGSITATIDQADTLTEAAPVNVTTAAAQVLAASASRRAIHFRNTGNDVIYLGAAGVSIAGAALALNPGEEWREESAAAAAWSGIVQTTTSALAILEIS